jgi:lysophospholipase
MLPSLEVHMKQGNREILQDASEIIEEEGPYAGNDVELYFRSARPAAGEVAHLAIVHGYGDHGGRYLEFMRWMATRGITCHALPAIQKREDRPLFVLGHSHGGLVVAAAGVHEDDRLAQVRGCILTSPFFRNNVSVPARKVWLARAANPVVPWLKIPIGLREEWMSSDPQMVEESRRDPLRARVATPRWYLGMRRAQQRVMKKAGQFSKPLLILTGSADPVADPAAAQEFYERVGSADKTYRSYPDLLHEILREKQRETAFTDIRTWILARTVPPAAD